MFHTCEESHLKKIDWKRALFDYRDKLRSEYPGHDKDIIKWAEICKAQFPVYLNHWQSHYTTTGFKSCGMDEHEFRFNYTLPSGDVVVLRGKIDSVKIRKKTGHLWVQENKTKGEIDELGISSTVDQNLQTVIYHLALRDLLEHEPEEFADTLLSGPPEGTIYNVIRRPLSDRYSIRKRKRDTDREFYLRIAAQVREKRNYFFHRWPVEISSKKIKWFQRHILDPILEQLNHWWLSIKNNPLDPWNLYLKDGTLVGPNPLHFRSPFGVFNPLGSGFRGDYFNLFTKGSQSGLVKVDNLFPELSL